jgi:hypothetical protein
MEDQAPATSHAQRVHASLRVFLQGALDDAKATLVTIAEQARLIAQLQTTVRTVRIRAVRAINEAVDAAGILVAESHGHSGAPGDAPPLEPPAWFADVRHACAKVSLGHGEAIVWKNLSEPQRKRINDAIGGRDVLFRAATDIVVDGRTRKRPWRGEEEVEEGIEKGMVGSSEAT